MAMRPCTRRGFGRFRQTVVFSTRLNVPSTTGFPIEAKAAPRCRLSRAQSSRQCSSSCGAFYLASRFCNGCCENYKCKGGVHFGKIQTCNIEVRDAVHGYEVPDGQGGRGFSLCWLDCWFLH